MKERIKIILIVVTFILQEETVGAQAKPEKFPQVYFQMGYNQGISYDGHVQVREDKHEGTFLKLKENLGMSSWISPTMTLGLNFESKNIFESTYTRHFFKGSEYIPNPTWYNGTLYAPFSKATIDRTIYRGFELVWKTRIFHSANTNFYSRVAVDYERLKFYVDGPVDKESPKSETFEIFWRQQIPLPTLGVYAEHKISKHWLVNTEAYATFLPLTDTWMKEGGTVHLQQTNFDAKLNLAYKIKFMSVSPGIWYKHFWIKEESSEDENRFLLNGFGYRLTLAVNY
jgi:hypothetical protein